MKRYVLLLLLAGCAQTPNEIRESPPTMHKVKGPASESAHCMMRGIENFQHMGMALLPQIRPMPPGYEVIVNTANGTVMVAQVMPEGSGAVATIWTTGRPIIHGRDDMKAAMLSGC